MTYFVASDLHGSAYWTEKLFEKFDASGAQKIILAGDLLYHGPRNDLPKEYDTKRVAKILNEHKQHIYTVKGNCDGEVDQMVLDFPCLANYAIFELGGRRFYLTHGHHENPENLPPLLDGEVFIYGHTHIPMAEKRAGNYMLNPGSVSLPKGGYANSYAILEDETFRIIDFEGCTIKEICFE